MISDDESKRTSKAQPEVMKILECPVCYDRITPPVKVCVNGHATCNGCRAKLQNCPTCKSSFTDHKNTILDQIIQENVFACKFTHKGCKAEMKLIDIEEHELKHCKYRPIVCTIVNSQYIKCDQQISLCNYFDHVNTCHKDKIETVEFSSDIRRTIDITSDLHTVKIMQDLKTSKIVFEVVKLDKTTKTFYVIYIMAGLSSDADKLVYELNFNNIKDKHKELKFKNFCIPLGMTQAEMEDSDRCLILRTNIFSSFTTSSNMNYSVKFETVAKKWYKKVGRRWSHNLEVLTAQ